MKFCATCNHPVKDYDQFCSVCGTRLNRNTIKTELNLEDETEKEVVTIKEPVIEKEVKIKKEPVKEVVVEKEPEVLNIKLSHPNKANLEPEEIYELRPRFVFVYELLPSSLSTLLILIAIFAIGTYICNQYNYDRIWIVIIFAILFLLKEFKVFYRKFRYRNIKYVITDLGVEYVKEGNNGTHFYIPYEEVSDVRIQRNLATYLFGYGHILVKNKLSGIYLDYVSEVNQVYEYILSHTKR